jgi:peptidoglycan/xylan/chitin deacetylase (PgdA/CDA1 family)
MVWDIRMTNKIAYLTIDDAPSPQMNEKVDYLLRKGIPAVWFCRGDFLEQRPDLAIYAIQKGFVLGNHAYNHLYFSGLELAECFAQIERTDEIIESLYARAGLKRPAKYFRFPYGDKGGLNYSEVHKPYSKAGAERKQALQTHLRRLGHSQPVSGQIAYEYYRASGLQQDVDWYWTYDVMDWSIFAGEQQHGVDNFEKILVRMDEDEPEDARGLNDADSAEIVLMHDHTETAAYFEPLVERLLAKGLRFVPVEPDVRE